MDRELRNSLEAMANLIYLIRHSLHDPAAAVSYLDLAEENLKEITLRSGLCPAPSDYSPSVDEDQKAWLAILGLLERFGTVREPAGAKAIPFPATPRVDVNPAS
jgi:hypothetical protein